MKWGSEKRFLVGDGVFGASVRRLREEQHVPAAEQHGHHARQQRVLRRQRLPAARDGQFGHGAGRRQQGAIHILFDEGESP